MTYSEDPGTIRDAAMAAIDEDKLARVLELIADGQCDQEAVAALRAVVRDELVRTAFEATSRAERRGRLPTGRDIGTVADRHGSCCCGQDPYGSTRILKGEW